MAEAFPSAILDTVLKRLEHPIFSPDKLKCGLGIQLRDLRSKLELIRSVIYEAELMGILFPKLVREWVCELQCLLHEVDDLLDEALTRSLPESSMVDKVRLHLRNLPTNLTLAHKMKNANERLESIVKKCYECNLLVECGPPEPSSSGGSGKPPIARKGILRYDPDHAKDDEFMMIGRDNDKKYVIKMLFDESPYSTFVLINGGAGVGKSTLCRAVYNDEDVRNHFQFRYWVGCGATEGFDEAQLTDEIVSSIGKGKTLLVLDCFPPRKYYPTPYRYSPVFLSNLKVGTYQGTKILVASREIIWDLMSCLYPVLENNLSEKHSWSIFKNATLVPGGERKEWTEDLGRQIVRRCLGNPALLKGVGTLLRGKESKDDKAMWEYFAHEFDFSGQYCHYVDMSSVHYFFKIFHQSCGYLSLFIDDEFKYEPMMNQCAANGFINLSDKMQKLFQDTFLSPKVGKVDWDDADKNAVSSWEDDIKLLAGADSVTLGQEVDLPIAARHVSIVSISSSTNQQEEDNFVLPYSLIKDVKHKRSLLFSEKRHPIRMHVQTLDMLASSHRYLRVLDLQDLALKELPSSMGKLIHLRYLDVSRNDFKELPRSICRLKNLQTLRLFYCDKLIKLPGSIKNIRRLKHLEINMCLDLTHMPSKIARITDLQRLDRFLVSPHKGGLRYLEHLDRLSGHLTIELPQKWEESMTDAGKACLEKKEGLTALEFKWQSTGIYDEDNGSEDVLERLKPSSSIENLFIANFGGRIFPNWITTLGMGNGLTRVTISHCKRCDMLPPFHVFPKLKYLTLTSMMNIQYLQDNNGIGGDVSCVEPSVDSTGFFPTLFELKIGCMPKLTRWSRNLNGLGPFPKIALIEIWNCPRLTVMPSFRMLKNKAILQDVSEAMLQAIDWGNHKKVEIISIQDLVSMPNDFVTNFPMVLEVKDCNKWQRFWTNNGDQTQTWRSLSRGFESLRCLLIINCRTMKHLSGSLRHLINLGALVISRCSEELDCLYDEDEDGMPWKSLKRLFHMEIEGFENLEAIPKGFGHLPSLDRLVIMDCKSLKSGVDNLPEAKKLYIKSCPDFFVKELERECRDVSVIDETTQICSGSSQSLKLAITRSGRKLGAPAEI